QSTGTSGGRPTHHAALSPRARSMLTGVRPTVPHPLLPLSLPVRPYPPFSFAALAQQVAPLGSLMVQIIIALSLLIGTLLVGVFFAYVYCLKRQQYLLYWTAAWVFYGLHYLCPGLSPWTGEHTLLTSLNHALFGFAGI